MSALANEVLATKDPLGFLVSYKPVYARDKNVAAYEVLLDDTAGGAAALPGLAGDTVRTAYAEVYQKGRVKSVPSVLRVTPAMLTAIHAQSLPSDRYILEVNADDYAPEDLPDRLGALTQKGYRLALAGYRPERDQLTPLLDTVQIVRLDLRKAGLASVGDAARRLCFHPAKLLVDSIDDITQFYDCVERDVTYFQGNFLNVPVPVKGKRLAANKEVLLALLAELRKPDTSPAALEQLAIKDPGLSYRLLKIVNSAALGLGHQINSLSQAIVLLGTDELSRWVNLLLVHGEPGKPDELLRSMLVRGRMCEVIAALASLGEPASCFIVGLFSRLDVLMDMPMAELLQQVPLGPDVKHALLHRGGPIGRVLAEVECYEEGQFDRLAWLLDPSLYEVAYRHSVKWALQSQQALGSL